MANAQDPCPIGPDELLFSHRHVARPGHFKEFYRAVVPNVDGEHIVTLIDTTWAGCGPSELDGEHVIVKVAGGKIAEYRWLDEGEDGWREYDDD
jgi:hypothetical protein